MARWMLAVLVCSWAVIANPCFAAGVGNLRCEYRTNPEGLDVVKPRLSWIVNSDRRGDKQTAYRVLVASSAELLAKGTGDLWDRRDSNPSPWADYSGKLLRSRMQCFWKVRVWDKEGRPSDWSPTARWSLGLLDPADWTAQWISDPVLADPAHRPLTPIHCYRSELASRPDAVKWIVIDLGSARRMDAIDVIPARPRGQNFDFRSAMFPQRFKVEAAGSRDFSDAGVVVDKSGADIPDPRRDSCRFSFPAVTARYVRLTVTRLARWDGQDYAIALGGLVVLDGTQSISTGARVECSDSIENDRWSKNFLVDGKDAVALAADAPALAAGIADVPERLTVSRVPLLRREFTLASKVRRATLHVSARGFYEVRINGQRVGDELLAPGYTDFGVRIQYQSHDVTSLLHPGANAIGALLGYGWYAGHMNLSENRCIYGYFPQWIAQLDIDLADGKHLRVCSDAQWRSTLDGPVRWSDLLDGEGYDCRREIPGWDQPGFDDGAWQKVWSQPRDGVPLVWQRSQPVTVIQEIHPASVKEVKPGVTVFDLGQEITGWCRLKVDGPPGTHLRLRHAEIAAPDGSIDVNNLWGTAQQEDYILDGKGPRTLEPHFTYHGFRYVELSGLPGDLQSDTLTAVNVRTAAPIAGRFECSNDLYNRIRTAAQWTQANMLFDVPAGCAARSERLAWTGDIRPCVQAALFNFDSAAFFAKYSADLRDDQTGDGRFTDICPHAHLGGTDICVGSPGWADAGVSLPWQLYVNTGDRRVLADHFEAAHRWVDAIHASNPDGFWKNNRGMNWGDWLSAGPATPADIGSTAFFAHSTDLVARMAQALGRTADAQKYSRQFQEIRQAFIKNYVSPDGVIGPPVSVDVTGIVRGLVKDGKLAFTLSNEVMKGDPAPNHLKSLHLLYSLGGKEREQVIAEGQPVDVQGSTAEPVQIMKATYGSKDADSGDVQGSYALALQFGLLDEPLQSRSVRRLAEMVAKNGYHPTTGFWSSVELLLALSSHGQHSIAARMVDQRTRPSWGYMVESGGTTLWEAFDANTRNLSLNHWTHSAVNEWLWRNVAGLNPDEGHPGYEEFNIRPRPTEEVSWCKATYRSIRGDIAMDWSVDGHTFTLKLVVPPGSVATVFIPANKVSGVMEGSKPASQAEGVSFVRMELGNAVFTVQSGVYRFTSGELPAM